MAIFRKFQKKKSGIMESNVSSKNIWHHLVNYTGALDLTIAVAIGALTATFFAALITLILICNRSRRKLNWEHNVGIKQNRKFNIPELALAFCDFGLENNLQNVINDPEWVDISGVIPHCLLILRTCHSLTKILAKLTMTKKPIIKESAVCLIEATKRIPSIIDDVLQTMHPSSDSRLLHTRMEALILAIGQLALLTQAAVGVNNRWIDQSLHQMEQILTILKTFKKYP